MRKCTMLLVVMNPENEATFLIPCVNNSPTGPGFVSISPLISSSRTTTTPTTILPRPEGMVKPETRRALAWDEERDRHQMFDITIPFWRTIAGSTLLRDSSMRGACLKVVWRGCWSMGSMWSVVAICACSAVTANIGSMIIQTASRNAWPRVTWPSWHWNWGLMHWGRDLRKALMVLAWLSGAQYWLELGKRRWSEQWIIFGKNIMFRIPTIALNKWLVEGRSRAVCTLIQLFRLTLESLVSSKSALNHSVLPCDVTLLL